MEDSLEDRPPRIEPYILVKDLSERVPIAPGPFKLVGLTRGVLDGELAFRWHPTTAVEFDGKYDQPHPTLEHSDWTLESEGSTVFKVPVLVTNISHGGDISAVRGIVQEPSNIGTGPFNRLRFCLANFPDYIGDVIRYQTEGGSGVFAGRLQTTCDAGECRLDGISEVAELVKRASRDPGYVLSHVGEWVPSSGSMTAKEAGSVIRMLHFWFGLLRSAWAGPLFPQGVSEGELVWRQFASWKLGEAREVQTWLPQRRPLDLSSLFRGFVERWHDPIWRDPLISAISWFLEANSSRIAAESKITLAQVALELLSWVHIVETQSLHSRTDFKRLSAAGRIRVLLQQIGVPAGVPDYLTSLPSLQKGDAFDGPGVITRVRNALVHATEGNRETTKRLDGLQLLQCAELALGYVELTLLAICGHDGYYARRGWRGWKGEDEVPVPWNQTG